MLEFIKTNIPWIALGFAIAAAIVIIALLAVNYAKKHKSTESEAVKEVAVSDVSTAENNEEEEKDEEVHIIYKSLDDDKAAVKVDKAERGKAKFAKQTAERLSDVAHREQKNVVGKWIIKEKGEGEYVAFLYANNGELILTSEIYSTSESAKKGVETIRRNLATGTATIYRDKNDNYYFKLKSVKNRILCIGETYKSKIVCENSFESVKRFAASPIQEEVEQDITVIKYAPATDVSENSDGKYSGKWKIEEKDGTFMAKLFASNGELLLNSESYVSYESAKSAVEVIKNNGLAGNFIIDSDKKGRYFFKLRSAQKATLCVGETYSQLSACKSAIDSVYRFLKTAEIEE